MKLFDYPPSLFLPLLALVGSGCTGDGGLALSGSPSAPTTGASQAALESSPKKEAAAAKEAPKAVAPVTTYDFGFQPVDTILERKFEIRNEGWAPLTLKTAGTSCSCTESTVDGKPIPPGSSGWVKLEWNVGKKVGPFSHYANIETNDPKQEIIRFNVLGMAQAEVEVTPENLNWDELQKNQAAQDQVLVTSQAWPEFRIEKIRCTVPGLAWEVEPASASELETNKAKSGRRIVVHIPAELTKQTFQGSLEFEVVPPGEKAKPIARKVEIFGASPKGLFLSGSCQEGQAAVFGTVRQGTSKSCNLVLKAKGFDDTFRIDRIVCEPSFIRCTATPILANGKNVGLFRVHVEIPADAPECIYQTPDVGHIRLFTNHPEKPELKFYVEFSVLP